MFYDWRNLKYPEKALPQCTRKKPNTSAVAKHFCFTHRPDDAKIQILEHIHKLSSTTKHRKTRSSVDIPVENMETNRSKYNEEYLRDDCMYLKLNISDL